jgi:hydroxypyruvate isomerase
MKSELSRRSAIKNIVAGTAAIGASATLPAFALADYKKVM